MLPVPAVRLVAVTAPVARLARFTAPVPVLSAVIVVAVNSICASSPMPTVASRSSVVATRSAPASVPDSSMPPALAVRWIRSGAVTLLTAMSPVVLLTITSFVAPVAVTLLSVRPSNSAMKMLPALAVASRVRICVSS